jgi:hypothetical protein
MASAELQRNVQAADVAARTSAAPAGSSVESREPHAIAQIRAAVQELLAAGKTEEAMDYSLAALAGVLRKLTEYERLLAQLRRQHACLRSERISPEQLALLLEELQQLEAADPKKPDPEVEAREDEALRREIEEAEEAARARGECARPRTQSWRARDRAGSASRGRAGRGADVRHVWPGEAPDRRRHHARAGIRAGALQGE